MEHAVKIPGAFAHYLEGTSDLNEEPHPHSVALRESWAQAVWRRVGNADQVELTASVEALALVLDHARFVALMSRTDGEWERSEIRGAKAVVERLTPICAAPRS